MIISNGLHLNPIDQIEKKIIVLCLSPRYQNYMLEKWIISSISPKGELIIDDGAKGTDKWKSLLAAGIKKFLENLTKVIM